MIERFSTAILLATCLLLNSTRDAFSQDPIPIPIPQNSSNYRGAIESHMDYVTEHSLDELGEVNTAMWLATIDIRSNNLPKESLPKELRWYRKITSPGGSNLYWDQPTIVAAYELSRRTGCACYEDAADAYIQDHASSTEVGLWAGSLVRASQLTGNEEFRKIAGAAIKPWLHNGFDNQAKKYFGRLSVETAKPLVPEQPRGYTPPMYADVFDIHERPSHNYPMPMAEACLSLYQQTREDLYRQAVVRWTGHVRGSLPANGTRGAYAEDYGRVIHFLLRAAEVLECNEYRELAVTVADEAMEQLYVPKMGMFRSHPGEDRCDAVDGPGILLLALLYLDGELPESAFGF